MASIFSTYFHENDRRLSAVSRAGSDKAREGSQPGGHSFDKILADVEKREQSVALNVSQGVKNGPGSDFSDPAVLGSDALTNLNEIEQQRLKLQSAAPHPTVRRLPGSSQVSLTASPPGAGEAPILAANLSFTSVKAAPGPVKVTPPGPVPLAPTAMENSHGAGTLPANRGPYIADKAPEMKQPEIKAPEIKAPSMPVIVGARRIKTAALAQRYNADEIKDIVKTAGKFHGVPADLSLAVAHAESSLRVDAVSKDGHHTKGVFQLLDSTGKDMLDYYGLKDHYDPFDPGLNSYLGVGYLKRLHKIFSQETQLTAGIKTVPAKSASSLEKLALAAFNAGEGAVALAQARVREAGGDPADYNAVRPYLPASTRAYVDRVGRLRVALKASEAVDQTG